MQVETAEVVDLQAYRRQRAAASRAEPAGPPGRVEAPVPLFWYPVWMFVPVVMVPH